MQIIFLDAPEAKQIVDKILEAKPIVLAGSGISTFKSLTGNDTCLPSGKEFTEDMFDYLLPPDFFGYNLYMIKILREQWQNVVFENLLESCPDYDKLRRIIKKSFIKAEPNQIHKCISDIFIKGDFSGLITTNYDQCFDNLLKNHDVERVVIKEDYDLVKQPFENLYFKIHGSIDDTDGKTLVFALHQEGFLKEWKREFLPKMIQTNSLFIVGYSGSDFEICPELLKLPIETVFWNLTGKNKEQFMNKLNFNTNEFLKKKDGYFLVGDMKVLFSSITNQPINLDKGESSKDFFKLIKDEASFTKMEIGIWRASILNTIGCASLAFKASEEVLAMFREKDNEASEEVLAISPEKDNEAKIRRQLAKSLYDLGKYNQSAK
jgi:SIR2-like domain